MLAGKYLLGTLICASSRIRETGTEPHFRAINQKPNCKQAIAPVHKAANAPPAATSTLVKVTNRRISAIT